MEHPIANTLSIRAGRDILAILPAAALTAYWSISSLFEGAYFPSAWYPAAIVVVVVCPLLLAAGWRLPVGGSRVAFGLLTAFVAWTALSILWADAGGHALEATNKLLLALASAFVFAITPWNERRGFAIAGLLAVGVAIASVATLLLAAYTSDPATNFIEQRYAAPLGYAGASAAFAALAVWPALAISARRPSPGWLRAAMFAIVVVQAQLSLLPQARGVMIGLAVSAVVFLAFSPSRGWACLRLIAVAAIVYLTIDPILNVYTIANDGGSVVGPLHDAVRTVAIAAIFGLLAGFGFAAAESRLPQLPGGDAASKLRIPALTAALVAIAFVAIVFGGSIADRASERWNAFKSGQVERSESNSHLTSFGDPERYDYWRVALEVAGDSPLKGIGAGNFQDAYTVDRHSQKHSKYAHSIWMRALSDTGIVGLALLLGTLVTGVFAVARGRRKLQPQEQLLTAGTVSVTVLVFAHASVDWVEEFPAVLGAGLCLLFLAGRIVDRPPDGPPRRQAAGMVSGLVMAGLALASLVPAYLSVRFVDRAEAEWVSDPGSAYEDLDRATYLNPLTAQPDILLGEIAIARGEDGRGMRAFEQALQREDTWYPHFKLATIASQNGRPREAITQMFTALRLNRVDPLLQDGLETLRNDQRLNAAETQEQIHEEVEQRFYHLRPPGQPGR